MAIVALRYRVTIVALRCRVTFVALRRRVTAVALRCGVTSVALRCGVAIVALRCRVTSVALRYRVPIVALRCGVAIVALRCRVTTVALRYRVPIVALRNLIRRVLACLRDIRKLRLNQPRQADFCADLNFLRCNLAVIFALAYLAGLLNLTVPAVSRRVIAHRVQRNRAGTETIFARADFSLCRIFLADFVFKSTAFQVFVKSFVSHFVTSHTSYQPVTA